MADVLTRLNKYRREREKTPPGPPLNKAVRFGQNNQPHKHPHSHQDHSLSSLDLHIPDFDFMTDTPNLLSPSSAYNVAPPASQGSPKIPIHLIHKRPGPGLPPLSPAQTPDSAPQPSINDANEDWNFSSYHLDYKHTPPIVKGPCCVCNEGIIGAMVTSLDRMWHPRCFTCHNCHVELLGPNYQEHDGKPYCKACHHSLFLPPCAGCGKELHGNYVNALDKLWHPHCFTCTACGIMLTPPNFMTKDFKPYCDQHYHSMFSPKCSKCKEPIKDQGKKIFAKGKQYHTACFRCCECGIQLDPTDYREKDGNLYCTKDFNDLFKPKCAKCYQPILENPTQAMGQNFHPACFRCTECKKQLSPNSFMEKNSQPYCPEDYHRLFSPKCAGCNKPIKDKKNMITAMGKNYHPEGCFNCIECHKNLSPNNYFEKNGRGPYCEEDFHRLFSPKCNGCFKPIKDKNDMITVKGKPYHKDHFCCDECKRPLNPGQFYEKDGKKYCPDDFHRLFSPKCSGCSKPITDKMVIAQGKKWHQECFKCTHCERALNPDVDIVFEKEGRAYCETDYHNLFSPKCGGCGQPIKNKYVFAMGKYFHPEHFTCAHCGVVLQENAFYEKDGKAYCIKDFMALFAPKCKACTAPIMDEYCLYALDGDWHARCFKCKECNRLLEHENFYEYQGDPYCEEHYHAKICPDCIKLRRAEYRYFERREETSSSSVMRPSSSFLTLADEAQMDKAIYSSRPSSRQSEFSEIKSYDARKEEMKRSYQEPQNSNGLQIRFHVHENENENNYSSSGGRGTGIKEHFINTSDMGWNKRALMDKNFNDRSMAVTSYGGGGVGGKNNREERHEHMEEFSDNKLHPEKFPHLDNQNVHFQQFVKKDEYQSVSHGY